MFFDVSKAFDTVNVTALENKLSAVGVRSVALRLFVPFASRREMYMCLEQSKSETFSLEDGVPQGSVLGTVLFLMYVNDLFRYVRSGSVVSFADDTSVVLRPKTTEELEVAIGRVKQRWGHAVTGTVFC